MIRMPLITPQDLYWTWGANLCVSLSWRDGAGATHDYGFHSCPACTDRLQPIVMILIQGTTGLGWRLPWEKLCFNCHEEKKNEISQYTRKHEPVEKGIASHATHLILGNNKLPSTRVRWTRLCFTCHIKTAVHGKRNVPARPLVQGNCSACHNAHGADNPLYTRLSFPHEFYSEHIVKVWVWSCVLTVIEALVTTENA